MNFEKLSKEIEKIRAPMKLSSQIRKHIAYVLTNNTLEEYLSNSNKLTTPIVHAYVSDEVVLLYTLLDSENNEKGHTSYEAVHTYIFETYKSKGNEGIYGMKTYYSHEIERLSELKRARYEKVMQYSARYFDMLKQMQTNAIDTLLRPHDSVLSVEFSDLIGIALEAGPKTGKSESDFIKSIVSDAQKLREEHQLELLPKNDFYNSVFQFHEDTWERFSKLTREEQFIIIEGKDELHGFREYSELFNRFGNTRRDFIRIINYMKDLRSRDSRTLFCLDFYLSESVYRK